MSTLIGTSTFWYILIIVSNITKSKPFLNHHLRGYLVGTRQGGGKPRHYFTRHHMMTKTPSFCLYMGLFASVKNIWIVYNVYGGIDYAGEAGDLF